MRSEADWFHYSVDYRIGTRYLDEVIVDNFKCEAMKTPLLREMLRSDSIYISSNITFDNLTPLSAYLGKLGDVTKGGIALTEFLNRQRKHHEAETKALLDTSEFIRKAKSIYGYDHFICDTSGSICEIVDPENASDPILTSLSKECLIVYIEESDEHKDALKARFDRAPKPMFYNEQFLIALWKEYLKENNVEDEAVNPDAFIRWGYARLIDWRAPRYRAIAANWGVSIPASEIATVATSDQFLDVVDRAVAAL